jgi:hypothetical protein
LYVTFIDSVISKVELLLPFSHLRTLGAKEIVPREGFQGDPRCPLRHFCSLKCVFLKVEFLSRPLGKELYAGAVDACGGKVLANILPLVIFSHPLVSKKTLTEALSKNSKTNI